MFWRFGFHNASSIDTLLDREDVALEEILDEDDLLQECKAQNTRLIDYFQRPDVLQRLFGYVTGTIESEDKGRFKYPYVATEVLCSEIWSIVEACIANREQLLAPFWENVLDRSPDDLQTRMAMASHFSKINGVFMTKKPAEMFEFIKSQPPVVERIIRHIETPPIIDLLFRIIQLDGHPSCSGILEWLTSERLIPRLVDLLSPVRSPEVHLVAAEVIKGIITMSAPSPGASAMNDGLQHVPASNRFARELASRENVSKLLLFMLDDFPLVPNTSHESNGTGSWCSNRDPLQENASGHKSDLAEDLTGHESISQLPNVESATSSVINSISIILELIRKNNSDYFEPYLFHNLRNRLIQVQQQLHLQSEDAREVLEKAMKELVDRMGVVHLGVMLEIMCERLDSFQQLLKCPRTLHGPVSTTIGPIIPLTLERLQICELYAELLHCSNMALLNRPPGIGPRYDEDGRLLGGLSALEELARVISIGNGDNREGEEANGDAQEMVEAKELPVHTNHSTKSADALDSDSDLSDQGSDEATEDTSWSSEPPFPIRSSKEHSPLVFPSSPEQSLLSPLESLGSAEIASSRSGDLIVQRPSSQNARETSPTIPVGDVLKRQFMDMKVVSTLLDLFFQFPWNNLLHGTVYDLVHQILTGRVDGGLNRDLIIALFRDARLLHRILEAHEKNLVQSNAPKGVRLGYMGHLTLISEDVISALQHYPDDLANSLRMYAPQQAWDEYVHGGYQETKKRDSILLGGGKPILAPGIGLQKGRWTRVDEADNGVVDILSKDLTKIESSMTGEFRRTVSPSSVPTNTADFGSTQEEDEPAGPTQFARYLAEEIHATPASQFTHSGSSSDASDDDEDDDGGWLARSSVFDLEGPPSIARNLQGEISSGFDDAFVPMGSRTHSSGPRSIGFSDTFTADSDEDDAFGPFSDAMAPNGTEFTFTSDPDDSPFDFGDFQAAEAPNDGENTPTGGSWTFEGGGESSPMSGSGLSFGGSSDELRDSLEAIHIDESDDDETKRRFETHTRSPSTSQ